MMISNEIDKIIKDIITIVSKNAKAFVKDGINSNSSWTNKNFSDLTRLAYENNYWVYTKPNDHDHTTIEWLYDMTWYESNDKGKIVKDIPVIIESEWNKSFEAQAYDFQKLIQARAKVKIFIFQTKIGNVENRIKRLIKVLQETNFTIFNDKYIFIGWDDDIGFHYYHYMSNIGLQKLPHSYDEF